LLLLMVLPMFLLFSKGRCNAPRRFCCSMMRRATV
jgi:hypothetical protein